MEDTMREQEELEKLHDDYVAELKRQLSDLVAGNGEVNKAIEKAAEAVDQALEDGVDIHQTGLTESGWDEFVKAWDNLRDGVQG